MQVRIVPGSVVQAAVSTIKSFYAEKGLLHLVLQEKNRENTETLLAAGIWFWVFFPKVARRNTDKWVYV